MKSWHSKEKKMKSRLTTKCRLSNGALLKIVWGTSEEINVRSMIKWCFTHKKIKKEKSFTQTAETWAAPPLTSYLPQAPAQHNH